MDSIFPGQCPKKMNGEWVEAVEDGNIPGQCL